MIELKSSVATIKTKNNTSIYKLDVDNGTVVYMAKVKNDDDIIAAIQKSIKILSTFSEYSNYISELEAILV